MSTADNTPDDPTSVATEVEAPEVDTQAIPPVDETELTAADETTEPGDEAQVIDPVDDTQVIDPADEAQVIDPVDEAQVIDPAVEAQFIDPVEDTQIVEPADETQVIEPAVDTQIVDTLEPHQPTDDIDEPAQLAPEPVAMTAPTEHVAETHPLEVTAPLYGDHVPPTQAARNTDTFDLFATPAMPTSSIPEPSIPEPSTPPTPAATVVDPPEPERRRLRVGTVVWGLILAACGLGVIAWASGARIDFQLALIILFAVAGSVLLVGSILSGARHARR